MKEKILKLSIIAILIILLSIILFKVVKKYNKKDNENTIYGTIKEVGSNYVIANDGKEDLVITVLNGDDYEINSLITITYKDSKKNNNKIKLPKIDVIYKLEDEEKENIEVVEKKEETINNKISEEKKDIEIATTHKKDNVQNDNRVETKTTTKITYGSIINTSEAENNIVNVPPKEETIKEPVTPTPEIEKTNDVVYTENDVMSFAASTSTSEDENIIKNGFISLVDFIFYNGEIKGYKFNDLTGKAKLTIIKYSLLVDSKIDKYFPGYKNTIATKYNNIKTALVVKYLDITEKYCSEHSEVCAQAKEDFASLKSSCSITWDLIKNVTGLGITKLKNWYEIFSGK